MLPRLGIFVLLLIALGLLWPRKLRAALGFVGIAVALAAAGVLIIVLINLPAPQ